MIQVGDNIPAASVQQMIDGKPAEVHTQDFFKGKKVVLFAVPGAFTPTCSAAHLPGYVVLADEIKAKGIDAIVCLAVNDAFVMDAWGKAQNASELLMWGDGDGSFTKALGLDVDTGAFGGLRSRRYAMVVEDGVVTLLNVEPPKTFENSKAEVVLAVL
ncbi:peroxiredoxin [Gallaecimonas pentaromativorans]|uniref:Glutathione-dependent peroxiredoxin n=1 Tax=Gallaecimonas pentaromativorans TaxID=584787 RepID=A0A3N1P1J4_9GAMM|nr:peroxiredoxin [Gallaecimonas pentaromativorans]ROQ21919.1 peroxiredoxin [Gallaecimonas pentaromativorans]